MPPMDSHPHSSASGRIPSIPTHSRNSTTLRCCCGRDDCTLLEHNNVALEGLEKDLATAAKLGQALLHRHESYMAEAEEDRHRLLDSVDALEREKRQVQAENARIVEENRSLLEQLDGLNQAVTESDDHVQSLTVTLESTQAEMRRLTVAASRAAELEAQLVIMETEQSVLQESLLSAREDEKSALQRWKTAETTLRDLNDQVERIEAEAREERERHEELVQRMERKRQVERELDNAAGRLKGAAAASEIGRQPGTPVISRFVKDILQDNAHLQVGIMELRDMLESSNQEVQNLRDQVLCHQPLAGVSEESREDGASTPTLGEELESKERRVSQEFHIHHHYHQPSAKKDKAAANRRVKKKRPALGSPVPLHSAMGTNSPRRSMHRSQSSGSSMNTILSQTSVSIPPSSSRRWSLQSPPADSLASSPQSAFRTSSIFDRMDRGDEQSQPTSPDSTVFSSPLIDARTKGSDMPFRPLTGLEGLDSPGIDDSSGIFHEEDYERPAYLDLCDGIATHPTIPEESEPSSSVMYSHPVEGEPAPATAEDIFGIQIPYTPLRKSASHDSLLSVAGMDIHTPTNRHAHMGDWRSGMHIPRRIVRPSVDLVSTPPVISAPAISIDRAKSSDRTSRSLLASVAAGSVPSDSASVVSGDSSSTSSTATQVPRKSSTLGRRMGGWVLGKWGTAPVSSADPKDDTPTESSPNTEASAPASHPTPKAPEPTLPQMPLRFRFPGVNQKGPVMGLRPPPQAPASIHVQSIDEDLLRESLAEENG